MEEKCSKFIYFRIKYTKFYIFRKKCTLRTGRKPRRSNEPFFMELAKITEVVKSDDGHNACRSSPNEIVFVRKTTRSRPPGRRKKKLVNERVYISYTLARRADFSTGPRRSRTRSVCKCTAVRTFCLPSPRQRAADTNWAAARRGGRPRSPVAGAI